MVVEHIEGKTPESVATCASVQRALRFPQSIGTCDESHNDLYWAKRGNEARRQADRNPLRVALAFRELSASCQKVL
jgi:hypothetical protein